MPRNCQDLFMPKLIHATKNLFMSGFFMPMPIHAGTTLNRNVTKPQGRILLGSRAELELAHLT